MFVLIKYIVLIALYVTGIVIFFVSMSGKVKYGILFLIPLLPLQNIMDKFHQFPLGKDFNDILIIGMLIGWIIYKNSMGKPLFEKTSFNKIAFFYLIFTYITLWYGSSFLGLPVPISALDLRVQNWKNYMLLPLLFLITFNNIKDKQEIKQLLIAMCLSMFLMNYYTMRQVSDITAWWNRIKLTGTFEWLGPNEVAAFYATYTFVLMGIFLFIKNIRAKIILGALILMNLYCDLFMFSRGAYLATAAGLLLLGIFRNKKIIILVVVILLCWQTVLPQMAVERIEFSSQAGELDPSAQTRIVLWEQSIRYFKESPLIGVGFNVFSLLGMKRDTHNVFLRTLAEQGLIGLGFLLIIMMLALKKGWRLYRNANDKFLKGLGLGFSACVIAVIVGNFFGDRWTPLPLAAFFWVFLGLVERGNIIALSDNIDNKAKGNTKAVPDSNSNYNKGINLAQALKGSIRPKKVQVS